MTATAFFGSSSTPDPFLCHILLFTVPKKDGKNIRKFEEGQKEDKYYNVKLGRSQFIQLSEYGMRTVLIAVCRNSQKKKIIGVWKLFNLPAYGVIRISGWIVKLDKSNFEIMHNFLTVRGMEQRNS